MAIYEPRDDGVVIWLFDDLFLEVKKGFFSFTIEHRHIDGKDSKQTVGSVFNARCDSLWCPEYPLHDWTSG